MSSEADNRMDDDLPEIEPFDESLLRDATERLIKKTLFVRRVRYAALFTMGLGIGALALFTIGNPSGRSVDHSLLASAAFVNVRGNDKEMQVTATAAKGRFGIAVGFHADRLPVEQDPGTGQHTRFDGPDRPARFLLSPSANPVYLIVTDTPAEDIVRRFFAKRVEGDASMAEPSQAMDKLKEHLLGLGYSTLDIHKVNSP